MYDFLNIAPDTFHKYWLENNALEFISKFSERTGEVVPAASVAHDKNLEFKIIPSKTNPGAYYCNLSGSIHKYHNQGRHNADSFHYYDFIEEINHLQKTYDINPARTRVKSFEYGVNIQLPDSITPAQFINSIVGMPTKRFINMNAKKVDFGKCVSFFDYDLKAYYKADQLYNDLFNKPIDIPHNTVRIEIRIKKMRFLEQKRYQLKQAGQPLYLSALMKKDFTAKLGKILLDQVNQIIFYDPKINTEHLTMRQKLRLKDFQNPITWEMMNHKQRYEQQKKYKTLLDKCNHAHIGDKISTIVEAKINQLLSGCDQNGVQMHQKLQNEKYHKKGTFASLECRVQTTPPLNPKTKSKKKPRSIAKRFCKTCGRDISHQRHGSVYCSEKIYGAAGKRCRNAGIYAKRKSKRQKLILKETKILNQWVEAQKAIKGPETNRLAITLNTGQKLRPTIKQVIAWPWSQRRQIIELKTKGQKLTRSRAKKYVKFLKVNQS